MSATGQPLSALCKPVALASHRVQPTGSARIVPDGAAQSDDVVVDRAERCHRVHSRDLLNDVGAPYDLAAPLRQHPQREDVSAGQIDGPAGPVGGIGTEVETHLPQHELVDPLRIRPSTGRAAAQKRAHSRQKLLERKRLG